VLRLVEKTALVGPPGVILPWVPLPAEYQDCQLVVDVKSIISGGSAAILQTCSEPGADPQTLVTVGPLLTTGPTVTDITTDIGTYVRLALTSPIGSLLAISAWITPKAT
jgi:hypothetical protein